MPQQLPEAVQANANDLGPVYLNGYDQTDCLEDDLTERIKLRSEQVRLATFTNWPRTAPVQPEDLARDGFYYLQKDDQAKCIFCNLILKSWDAGDVVRDEHSKFNVNCPFLLHKQCGNVPINRPPRPRSSGAPGGIAKYPEYSKPAARKQTFRNVSIPQCVDELVEAGFYYEGHDDFVKCFHCGITICHWEADDDPFTEHIHWSPNCEYARSHPMANESFEVTPVIRRVIDMGYERELIRNAVRRRRRSGSEYSDLSSLVDALEKLRIEREAVYGRQDSEGNNGAQSCRPESPKSGASNMTPSLEEENRKLKESIICKICMERNVSVTFVPCGHLVACEICSQKIKMCPMCRKNIRGYVKTYLS